MIEYIIFISLFAIIICRTRFNRFLNDFIIIYIVTSKYRIYEFYSVLPKLFDFPNTIIIYTNKNNINNGIDFRRPKHISICDFQQFVCG